MAASAVAQNEQSENALQIARNGSQASAKGPADGDVIWIPPGQKHWHGASPTTAMTHMAITELSDGKAVDWLEKVSDTQYGSQS